MKKIIIVLVTMLILAIGIIVGLIKVNAAGKGNNEVKADTFVKTENGVMYITDVKVDDGGLTRIEGVYIDVED